MAFTFSLIFLNVNFCSLDKIGLKSSGWNGYDRIDYNWKPFSPKYHDSQIFSCFCPKSRSASPFHRFAHFAYVRLLVEHTGFAESP